MGLINNITIIVLRIKFYLKELGLTIFHLKNLQNAKMVFEQLHKNSFGGLSPSFCPCDT